MAARASSTGRSTFRNPHPADRSPQVLHQADPRSAKRFKQEARVLSRLQHPNVLRVLEHGEEAGAPFMAVEYVDGLDVAAWIDANGLPPPAGGRRRSWPRLLIPWSTGHGQASFTAISSPPIS